MELFLSPTELQELTGRRQSSAQVKMLRAMHIDFIRRPDGAVLVLKELLKKRMGLQEDKPRKRIEPNWKALESKKEKSRKRRTA